jgi:TetR/AcrR family transcriptional repressor of nem operon
MGRPRQFTEDEVIARASDLFWRRGFRATSVQDLVDATGLSRASLYGAFGGKEQILERTLDRYRRRFAVAGRALEEAGSAREGLGRFFDLWLSSACSRSGPQGCFLTQVATESEARTPAVERMLRESMAQTEAAFRRALRRGKRSGELASNFDERGAARFLGVFLQGIATGARAGRSKPELSAAVKQALRILEK